jgi:CRP/FNR family transcriptional regulator, cyclic AMP receptor protein
LPNALKIATRVAVQPVSHLQPGTFLDDSKKITKLKTIEIDPHVESLLKSIVAGKHVLHLEKNTTAFSQGDAADAIYFIQSGKVKLTVVSGQGKEAVLAMFGPREFFGEGCLVGQAFRVSTAMTTESSTLFRVQKQAMLLGLHGLPELSEKFTAALLARNISLEEDLCDQLFNHSEKRLARVLLKLSRLGQHPDMPDAKMPRLTHETLAEMVGTTRSRITFFMNKFRKLGLIEYRGSGDITVRDELLTDIVLHD